MNQPNLNGQTANLVIETNDSILGYPINQNLEIESVNGHSPQSIPLSASEAYALDAISDGLTEINELDRDNETIVQEYDPDDEAILADNHGKIDNTQSTIDSIRQAAISRNPKVQTLLPRSLSSPPISSPAAHPSPKPSLPHSSLEDINSPIPTTPRNSYQVSHELDAFLDDLRDRLAQINVVGDRELPNLQIVVNNQEVYHRVNSIPQKLPAQINSEDVAYLSRVINLPEGTNSHDLNRNVRIKVDGKIIFELIAGEVLTNKLPQGQRAEEQGVFIGVAVPANVAPAPLSPMAKPKEVEDGFSSKPVVDNPEFVMSPFPESPFDPWEESALIDNNELPPQAERSPQSILEQIKDTNSGLTFHSTFLALQQGDLEEVEGILIDKKELNDMGIERTTIHDLSDTTNPRIYHVDNFTEEGILRLSSPETGEILSIQGDSTVNIVNLDDRSRNFIAKIEKSLTGQDISFLSEKQSQAGQGDAVKSTQTPKIGEESPEINPKFIKNMEL